MAVRLDCFISWSWFDGEGRVGVNGYMSGVHVNELKGRGYGCPSVMIVMKGYSYGKW